jgi:cytochrome b subunit of formate dehydrogenase
MSADRHYARFTPSQRMEHGLLILAFSVLALTGLPQKYAAVPLAERLIGILGGIEAVRIVHRTAAVVLMAEVIWHLVEVSYNVLVRQVALSMLPRADDLWEAWGTVLYNLGLARERPRPGRYTFEEKLEYWALVWGTLLMVMTGFTLWNPIATTRFLPGEFIPAALVAHGGEAVLAVLSVIVWHGYGVHLRHFNRSMWTGSLTEEEMGHEHPRELEEILAGRAEPVVEPATLARRRRYFLPAAGLITLALLVGLYLFVTFEETAVTTLPAAR